jgi:hypothetical protein
VTSRKGKYFVQVFLTFVLADLMLSELALPLLPLILATTVAAGATVALVVVTLVAGAAVEVAGAIVAAAVVAEEEEVVVMVPSGPSTFCDGCFGCLTLRSRLRLTPDVNGTSGALLPLGASCPSTADVAY